MNKKKEQEHQWKFQQVGGLVQVQLNTIDDVLNLDKLDPKNWTALACPVKGLEFSEETLTLLDTDKNGRVRVPEILEGVNYIKKYFAKPEIIMEKGDSIPLDALSETPFDCGHSPLASAKSVLSILGKDDATEISLADISVNEKLFSPGIINGDGVLPVECVKEENVASVVKDMIECTGGTDDISGVKGINRAQFEDFFAKIRSVKEWREAAVQNDPKIFFLKDATDSAAAAYTKVRDKINDFFLRCSLIEYDQNATDILKTETDRLFLNEEGSLQDLEHLSQLPIAYCAAGKNLPLTEGINPAWAADMANFKKNVISHIYKKEVTELTVEHWHKLEELFEPYINWVKAMPETSATPLGLDRITEILNSNAEETINNYLLEEEKHPPIALATIDLRKMLLYRRDFMTLVRNFVNFQDFYSPENPAIFQCGTLYIDGRSCELCFKVLDITKHGVMAALSQCFLVYCDCVKCGTGEKMQIAALISNGDTDNLLVGRNGLFFDRDGADWDATIVKITENPVSLKQAFWSPYKKLMRLIQEKLAKNATKAETNVMDKMSKTVDDPKANAPKKTDVGTVAAISVAITGIATIVMSILGFFKGLGAWIPLAIILIMLFISLPSVFIAWSKLRKRNIAPILDASGWAINGNVRITTPLGNSLTELPDRPAIAYLAKKDPYAQKKFPIKRVIFITILILLIAAAILIQLKFNGGLKGFWEVIKSWFAKHGPDIDIDLPDSLTAQ